MMIALVGVKLELQSVQSIHANHSTNLNQSQNTHANHSTNFYQCKAHTLTIHKLNINLKIGL